MLFITPLFLIFTLFVVWAFFKSVTRFKTQYLWYRHSRRPTNTICRVGHQVQNQQRQGSAVTSQNIICTHQCPQHNQTPQEHQYYYTRNQSAYHPHQQMQVMEMTIPQNCYVPPYYYNHQIHPYQYSEPPPIYPGIMPASQIDQHVSMTAPNLLYPTAPPLVAEIKE